MLTTILLVILILMLIGALPTWGYSSAAGDTVRVESSACCSSSSSFLH
jgi:hypothetical protein